MATRPLKMCLFTQLYLCICCTGTDPSQFRRTFFEINQNDINLILPSFLRQCDPNLVVYGVWVNTLDPRLPRIALFANRDIKAGEELTFDYQMTGNSLALGPAVRSFPSCITASWTRICTISLAWAAKCTFDLVFILHVDSQSIHTIHSEQNNITTWCTQHYAHAACRRSKVQADKLPHLNTSTNHNTDMQSLCRGTFIQWNHWIQ